MILLPFDARSDQLLDLSVASFESFRGHGPVARHAFLMRRRRAQFDRPIGPHERLVLLFRRLRQKLELRHRFRVLPIRRADAVGAGVAAADHDHVLAGRPDLIANLVAGDDLVLLRQEFHGEMDAGLVAAGDGKVARLLAAARQRDGVEARSCPARPRWCTEVVMT